ncbi:MAG TPA: Lrp/AsnC family transcriptional regulator [Anaerolineaceae bacterium]|nr:Lrp/AsnC family transcriptional regulator [Anaerolineaceae bacterium]
MKPPRILDQIDYQIICELSRDGRLKSAEIARKLGANERTIRKRIDALIAQGAIRVTAVVNPEFFGYLFVADIFMEVDPQREAEVIQKLSEMPAISYLAFGQGTSDLSIEARFKSNDELRHFIARLLPAIPGLKVTGYALVPRILRNIDEWMPPAEDFAAGAPLDETSGE